MMESMVEVFVGDKGFVLEPLSDAGVGTPPALAHSQPKLGVGAAEKTQLLRGAG